MLVTLLLLLVLALRTSVVSMISRVSSTLVVVSTMTIVIFVVLTNNSGVMSNNTRVMVAGLLLFMTVGSGDILALFDVGDINKFHSQHNILRALAPLVLCGTFGPFCRDNEDHRVAGIQCVHNHGQHWRHHKRGQKRREGLKLAFCSL